MPVNIHHTQSKQHIYSQKAIQKFELFSSLPDAQFMLYENLLEFFHFLFRFSL